VAVSWLITYFDGFDMNGIAYVAPYLEPAFHLDKRMLGNIFSAGLLGNFIGGFAFGALGDRIGRRLAIILASILFGVLTLCLALAQSYGEFLALRLIDGIAIGGMLPLCWALNIEYAPTRFRATVVTIIMMGYTLGVSSAGPVAIWVIPHYGWQSLFIVGGLGSLAAAVLLFFTLPESVRFLVGKGRKPETVASIARRLAPERAIPAGSRFVLSDEAEASERPSRLAFLFKGELRWITPLLWIAYAASSMGIYFQASWGPMVLEGVGFSRTTAAAAAAIYSFGGAVVGLGVMRFTDRHGAISIAILPIVAVPALLLCGLADVTQWSFLVLAFLGAAFVTGAHFGLISIAGIFYPSVHRGSGAGWASSIGKIGSIGGPLFGGLVLSSHLPVKMTYAILAICPAIVAVSTFALGMLHSRLLQRRAVSEQERAAAE
jgi:AAHS family 4-hydroxybenzoate transporter-like MFS transporter